MIKNLDSFKAWLTQNGAEVLITTNPYEVLRFRANGSVSVVYRRDSGSLTFTGGSQKAYNAFRSSQSWSGGNRTVKASASGSVKMRTIIERDGELCFYCLKMVEPDERTREHLLSKVHGGTNHISNQVLCHRACNQEAGHLPLIDKIKLREKKLLSRPQAEIKSKEIEPMKLTADNVDKIFMDCLFKDHEIVNGFPCVEPTIGEGIITKSFGFHPGRLASHSFEIKHLLDQLPDEFKIGSGDGSSFLNSCMTKTGEQWGEHRNMEQLFALGSALKLSRFCIPDRAFWENLPGGLPYIQVGAE